MVVEARRVAVLSRNQRSSPVVYLVTVSGKDVL